MLEGDNDGASCPGQRWLVRAASATARRQAWLGHHLAGYAAWRLGLTVVWREEADRHAHDLLDPADSGLLRAHVDDCNHVFER